MEINEIEKLKQQIDELRSFIEACLDCKTPEELEDFIVNNAEKVLSDS